MSGVKESPASARVALALAHHRAGRLDAAEVIYRDILESDPNDFDGLHLLGVVAYQRGRYSDAVTLIRRALVNSSTADAYHHLGEAYRALGDLDQARSACETSITLNPSSAETHNTYGGVWLALKQSEAAIRSFETAIALNPKYAEAHYNLGILLDEVGKLAGAEERLKRALELSPEFIQAQLMIAKVHQRQGREAEALIELQEVIAIDPTLADAHFSLGHMLQAQGFLNDALECFSAALLADPEFVEARWAATVSRLALVSASDDDANRSRNEFASELIDLDKWFTGAREERGYRAVGTQQPFFLAYYERNNCQILSRYGDLCSRLMSTWAERSGVERRRGSRGSVLRIGVIGRHFINHSVWNAITKGWLKHIDRSRFSLYLFDTGSTHDQETELAQSLATAYYKGLSSLEQWVCAIAKEDLDAIIYPEIGMDPLTVQLASLRLADVQLASWGHPETTGLPTMDYFISAERFEADAAQSNYRERLIMLPNLGCCYEPARIAPAEIRLEEHGIDARRPIFICAGTPFKYAPKHDAIFVQIAQRLRDSQFVFFDHHRGNLTELLTQRLDEAFDREGLFFGEHLVVIPWLSREEFHALLRQADVYLDTIGFSGFNSVMQALECDLPVVTLDGAFMRGRLGSGVLKHIGLDELVARTTSQYIEAAVCLARDKNYQATIRATITAERHRLFGDTKPVRSLEAALGQVCGFGDNSRV